MGENFYIGFRYGDAPDESEFLRTARSVWLEIKSDDVEEMTRKILEFARESHLCRGRLHRLSVSGRHVNGAGTTE